MASSVVFKVKYKDTLRRFNVLVNGDQCFVLNMEDLKLKICSLFDLSSSTKFSLVYTDEDNDLVTLEDDEDLHDVVKQGLNPVRITVCLKKVNSSKIGASPSENSTPGGSSKPKLEQASPSENSTPGGSSRPKLEQKVNPYVAEVLKSVAEPLHQAASKISTELTSKAASTSPVLGVTNISSHAEGRDDPKQKAPSDQKVDASIDKGAKHNDIPTSSSVQKSTKVAQATSEANFIKSSFPVPQLYGKSITSEQTETEQAKKYVEIFTGKFAKDPGCRLLNSSNGGVKLRVSYEKDAGKSVARGNTRGFLFGGNTSKLCNDSNSVGGEYPFSGVMLPTGHPLMHDQEKSVYDYTPPVQELHDSFHMVDGMGSIFHKGVRCDGCGVLPITGPRFTSKVKHNYDLCSVCFGCMGNGLDYIRIDFPLAYRHPGDFKNFCDPMTKHAGKQLCSRFDSRFIIDVNVIDGTIVAPSTPFTKIWRMRNNGTLPWQCGIQLLWIGGDSFSSSASVEIEIPLDGVSVGNEVDIAVDFVAPKRPGCYVSYWRMADPSGQEFGQRVWVSIQVDVAADLTLEIPSGLNLNLAPVYTTGGFVHHVLDLNEPVPNMEGSLRLPSMVEQRHRNKIEHLNVPIYDDLLVTSDVVPATLAGASSSSVLANGEICKPSSSVTNSDVAANARPSACPNPPRCIVSLKRYPSSSGSKNVIGTSLSGVSSSSVPANGEICKASSSVSNPDVAANVRPSGSKNVVGSSLAEASSSSVVPVDGEICKASSSVSNLDVAANVGPSAFPKFPHEVIDMNDGSSASSGEQDHGKNPVEETLLKELEDMGFNEIDLNKVVLRENEYDLKLTVDELCGVSEWDPILEELNEMGFEDEETNKNLLEKNNGSISRVVMDLLAGEKPL